MKPPAAPEATSSPPRSRQTEPHHRLHHPRLRTPSIDNPTGTQGGGAGGDTSARRGPGENTRGTIVYGTAGVYNRTPDVRLAGTIRTSHSTSLLLTLSLTVREYLILQRRLQAADYNAMKQKFLSSKPGVKC
jgi:hypothetical protein